MSFKTRVVLGKPLPHTNFKSVSHHSLIRLSHPIHLHGHDFWVIGQAEGTFDLATSNLNLINPPRRDVASLPANGYLAIAFKKDNPGVSNIHYLISSVDIICGDCHPILLLRHKIEINRLLSLLLKGSCLGCWWLMMF